MLEPVQQVYLHGWKWLFCALSDPKRHQAWGVSQTAVYVCVCVFIWVHLTTVIGQFCGNFWTSSVKVISEKSHRIEDLLTGNYYSVCRFFFLMICETSGNWLKEPTSPSQWMKVTWFEKEVIPQRLCAASGRAAYCLLVKRFILKSSSEKSGVACGWAHIVNTVKNRRFAHLLWI